MIFKAQAEGTATVLVTVHFKKNFNISRAKLKKAFELNDSELDEKIASSSSDTLLYDYYIRTFYDNDGPREELEELITQAVIIEVEDYPPAEFRVKGYTRKFEIMDEFEPVSLPGTPPQFKPDEIIFRKETPDDPANDEQTY